jgi:sterol desaturase/sphingolipid hydroxylase (fatty acid hydroxylase superfamily)
MLSGIQEILVIVVILLAILFIPRMMAPKRPQSTRPKPFQPMKRIRNLGVRWRIAIVASLMWLLGAAVYCRPWQRPVEMYLLLGAGPVILGWCVSWVVAGVRPRRKD